MYQIKSPFFLYIQNETTVNKYTTGNNYTNIILVYDKIYRYKSNKISPEIKI